MDKIKAVLNSENEKTKGAIAIIAAIITFVAPDYIDRIVENASCCFRYSEISAAEGMIRWNADVQFSKNTAT